MPNTHTQLSHVAGMFGLTWLVVITTKDTKVTGTDER